ncbi:MAG: ribonuclease HII [Vicingaceae bacterium]
MGLKYFFERGKIEVGCDEAGRGCLAGPVFAAAVILNPNKKNTLLKDSKKLKEKDRIAQRSWVESNALAWAVASVSPKEIDEINILNASFLAMHRAIDQLSIPFDYLLIDGNRFNQYKEAKHFCIINGDNKFKSIAAASILAKTYRDEYMLELHDEFPMYGWNKNRAYGTKAHRLALEKYGKCIHHRNSFRLL